MPTGPALAYTPNMMTPKSSDNFVSLAWNGLTLDVPQNWRPARLGLRYLYLEDDDGPTFEYKWRPGAGRDGMEAALRALTPKGRATTGMDLPEAWLDALEAYELMPLSWRREGRSGLGAALFHPESGTAAVFQAYSGAEGPTEARVQTVAAVLRSLDPDRPGPPQCNLYGLTFTAPPHFSLATFEFVPGRFTLSFSAERRRLDVVRLAPADVLLSREPLGPIAARTFGFDAAVAAKAETLGGAPAVWLASRQEPRGIPALLRALGRPGRLAVLKHQPDVNKLFGAAVTATRPVDRDWLAQVVAGCVSL